MATECFHQKSNVHEILLSTEIKENSFLKFSRQQEIAKVSIFAMIIVTTKIRMINDTTKLIPSHHNYQNYDLYVVSAIYNCFHQCN